MKTCSSRRKLAWIGRPYFSEVLRDFGWDVFAHDYKNDKPRTFTWGDIVDLVGSEPDVLVLGDKSHPPAFIGLEEFPCLTVFHCVDSHIHSWYPYYAQAFDLCSISLRDHLPLFSGMRLGPEQLLWSPPFAPDNISPAPAGKEWSLLFAGTVDPEKTPIRYALLKAIADRFPDLEVRHGPYVELYPRAKLVLNIAERGDLNYRVFEALACGSCLLTPAVGHGFAELFENGRDLFVYPQNDLDALLHQVEWCLRNSDRCEAVARAGFERVERMHRARHRAASFDRFVRSSDVHLPCSRMGQSQDILKSYLRLIYLHWAEATADQNLKETYLKAAKA